MKLTDKEAKLIKKLKKMGLLKSKRKRRSNPTDNYKRKYLNPTDNFEGKNLKPQFGIRQPVFQEQYNSASLGKGIGGGAFSFIDNFGLSSIAMVEPLHVQESIVQHSGHLHIGGSGGGGSGDVVTNVPHIHSESTSTYATAMNYIPKTPNHLVSNKKKKMIISDKPPIVVFTS
jgi:hypothetical protein